MKKILLIGLVSIQTFAGVNCKGTAQRIAENFVQETEHVLSPGLLLHRLVDSQERVFKFSVSEDYNWPDAYEVMVTMVKTRRGCVAKSIEWSKPPY